ncbi:MAG: response regulator, partial [Chloroflexota bacterium]
MSERILVVDDDQHIIDLAQMYLEQDGFTVESANDGRAALNKILDDEPALVVLDLMMPELDGWEVCRRVRAQSDVPIIMVTARGEDIDKIVGLELGADDYLAKPFELEELLIRVNNLTGRYTSDTGQTTDITELGKAI